MKTFVLIVIFTADLTGGARTERIASFDDYHSCVLAAQVLCAAQHWKCVAHQMSAVSRRRRAQ
jgi:hypothetical protein